MGEGFYGKVNDLFTYLIVTCDDETSVAAAERVTHRKCLQTTVAFSLEVRGANVITCTFKIAKLRFVEYCTSYRSTPYAHPGTRVLGAE